MNRAGSRRWIGIATLMVVTLGLAAPAFSAAPVPCPDGTFRLSGTVTSDINGLPLTEITSVGIQSIDGTYEDGEGTDLPGSTFSTCVPPGEYVLSFFADSFMFEWYNDAFDAASATPVVVTADVAGLDASLGWATITGRVTDKKTGDPELLGSISVVDATTGIGFDNEGTNADGVYTLSVPPGQWAVAFAADYHWSEWFDNKKKFSQARVIEVTPFTPLISGIDAELRRCSRTVPDFCFPRNFNR